MANPVGPDVSSYQHPTGNDIDWTQVVRSGCSFAFVKAGGDRTSHGIYTNPYFQRDFNRARAAGLLVGPYHWVSPAPAADQVAASVALIRPVYRPGKDLPVALDFEESGVPHERLHEVRDAFHAAGFRTITYTYPSFWRGNGEPACVDCAADTLWFADYDGTAGPVPAPWHGDRPWFWQRCGTAQVVPGIPGRNDFNEFMGTLDELRALARGATAPVRVVDEDVYVFQYGTGIFLVTGGEVFHLHTADEVRACQSVAPTRNDLPEWIRAHLAGKAVAA